MAVKDSVDGPSQPDASMLNQGKNKSPCNQCEQR